MKVSLAQRDRTTHPPSRLTTAAANTTDSTRHKTRKNLSTHRSYATRSPGWLRRLRHHVNLANNAAIWAICRPSKSGCTPAASLPHPHAHSALNPVHYYVNESCKTIENQGEDFSPGLSSRAIAAGSSSLTVFCEKPRAQSPVTWQDLACCFQELIHDGCLHAWFCIVLECYAVTQMYPHSCA